MNTKNEFPKILCIIDGPEWIFQRHVLAFQRYLGDEFEFITHLRGEGFEENEFDLIYPLEFDMVRPDQIINPQNYISGIRSFISWADWDFLVLVNFLQTHFKNMHVVSRQLYDVFSPYLPNIRYVTHGVDADHFSPHGYPDTVQGKLRIGWAGNRNTIVKGFREYIQPLDSIPGVELVHCGYVDQNFSYEEMPGFYDSIDAYICTSSFEGSNNSLLEAASCARAIITTAVGTAPEYLEDGKNSLIVDRNIDAITRAVIFLRDHLEFRRSLGEKARESIITRGWIWKDKAEVFRSFFHDSLKNEEITIMEITQIPIDFRHYSTIIQNQFTLVRELRIEHAYRNLEYEHKIGGLEKTLDSTYHQLDDTHQQVRDTQEQLRNTQEQLRNTQELLGLSRLELEDSRIEIAAIKNSETYLLAERVKASKIGQASIWIYKRLHKE